MADRPETDATRCGVIQATPKVHEAVVFALEKACQYAHAFSEEVLRPGGNSRRSIHTSPWTPMA